MYFVHPLDSERFAFRTLLIHVKGSKSFNELKIVNGISYSIFREADLVRDYLADDNEYDNCFTQASIHITDVSKLREIFVMILIHCSAADPRKLWENHKKALTQDIFYKYSETFKSLPIENQQNFAYDNCLHLINVILTKNGKKLSDYPTMPQYSFLNIYQLQIKLTTLINEELLYDIAY